MEKALFIDGQYLYSVMRENGIYRIDISKLMEHFGAVKAWYFSQDNPDPNAREKHERFLRALEYIPGMLVFRGITTVAYDKCPHCGQVVSRYKQKQVDVALTVEAMEAAYHFKHIIIIAGDSDFVPLLQTLRRKVCRLTLVCNTSTTKSELLRSADETVDLRQLLPLVRDDERKSDEEDEDIDSSIYEL